MKVVEEQLEKKEKLEIKVYQVKEVTVDIKVKLVKKEQKEKWVLKGEKVMLELLVRMV